jgi:hypothetical protein
MVHSKITNTPVSYRFPVNGSKPVNPRLPTALYIRAVNGKPVNGHIAVSRGRFLTANKATFRSVRR